MLILKCDFCKSEKAVELVDASRNGGWSLQYAGERIYANPDVCHACDEKLDIAKKDGAIRAYEAMKRQIIMETEIKELESSDPFVDDREIPF